MPFSHPLARDARVWPSHLPDGKTEPALVILTTLDLDPDSKKFKKDKVARLSEAAQEFLTENPGVAASFLLINRARDWHRTRA